MGEARNFGLSSFSLKPGSDGFSLTFSFKAGGPDPSSPINVGSLSGTGRATAQAPEPEIVSLVVLALATLAWVGRGRRRRF